MSVAAKRIIRPRQAFLIEDGDMLDDVIQSIKELKDMVPQHSSDTARILLRATEGQVFIGVSWITDKVCGAP